MDEEKNNESFLFRHRNGVLVLFCMVALFSVLGICSYFILTSPLLEQIRANQTLSGSVAADTAPTTIPWVEITEPAAEPTAAVIVPTEAVVATVPVSTDAVPAASDAQVISEPVTARSAAFPTVYATAQTKQNSNENRISNLRLVCQALNGTVLQPGEIFSFNETVGERTAENGYKPAPSYSGKNTPDIMGGGTNQGASTLYYCALLADLEIVERTNDEYLSAFIDPGLDAVVSWNGPDLKIRNNTAEPIQILAEADEEAVTIEIRGTTPRDYYTKIEYMMTTLYAETIYQEQQAGGPYADGELIQHGHDGAYVRTFRCKYNAQTDELISQKEEVLSSYPMLSNVVVRVVGAAAPTEPEIPTDTQPEDSTVPPGTPSEAPSESPAETQPPDSETTPPTDTAPEPEQ